MGYTAVVLQRPVELGELIDGFIADQGLAHKQYFVGLIHSNELRKRPHERFIVLHATCRIDQHHIKALRAGIGECLLGNACCILAIAALVQFQHGFPRVGHAICHTPTINFQLTQVANMSTELFHCPTSERVASGNEDTIAVLQKPEAYLC